MFNAILAAISNTTAAVVGSTGYIDGVTVAAPAKGVDSHGRAFFSLPLKQHVTAELSDTFTDENESVGTVTYFQRYTERPDLWAPAGDDHLACGGIKAPLAAFIEPVLLRVLRGETVTVEVPVEFHGWKKKTVTLSLITPSP